MKHIKRCGICGKRMWWWQAVWVGHFHLSCAIRALRIHTRQDAITTIKQKK